MSKRLLFAVGTAFAVSVGVASGCGSNDDPVADIDGGNDGDASTRPDADAGSDGGPIPDVEPEACTPTCSEDLHQVIACDGTVETTCPDDKGCAAGVCDDPCKAAEVNHSAKGCEYFAAVPAQAPEQPGACFAIEIANTWATDVNIQVEYQGKTLDTAGFARLLPADNSIWGTYDPLPSGKLPAGKVAVLFLSTRSDDCPAGVTPAVTDRDVEVPGTSISEAFRITTDRPVAAHEFWPYFGSLLGSGSASLLIPTSAWTTNYIAQTPFPHSEVVTPIDALFVQIVAKEDATEVEINPSTSIVGSGDAGVDGAAVEGAPAGQPKKYNLNKGQVLQLLQSTELAGSIVQSNHPVGLWGGATIFTVEVDQEAGDRVHAQVLPITSLGTEYPAVPYRNRVAEQEENPPWRLVGVVDGTKLEYQPSKPKNAPDTISQGEVVTFRFKGTAGGEAPYPFVVRSQDKDHPFYFWAYMTGGAAYAGVGDPEWVPVIATQQYLNSYLFTTNPTYPDTSLVVVREKVKGELKDVKLGCAGTLAGWQPFVAGSNLEFTRVDLVRDDFTSQKGCQNGQQTMTSDGPFGATVWGWGTDTYTYASYAMPAGMGARPLNGLVVPAH
jgi:hypothetical protein